MKTALNRAQNSSGAEWFTYKEENIKEKKDESGYYVGFHGGKGELRETMDTGDG